MKKEKKSTVSGGVICGEIGYDNLSAKEKNLITEVKRMQKDWIFDNVDAKIYGIIIGWDDVSIRALKSKQRFPWSGKTVEEIMVLHRKFLEPFEFSMIFPSQFLNLLYLYFLQKINLSYSFFTRFNI